MLVSGPAARMVFATSLLFPVGCAFASDGFPGLIRITRDSEFVAMPADLALSAVLFTDVMHASPPKLRANRLRCRRPRG
ncbi:hypothetical protein AB0L66_22745 [Streptomyces sp. NPDC052207]|uniref:hypothetical protein n=1 Tax=Streptomyces sp. NPDC052207 TaxID=3155418 RepID=UPI003447A86B